MVGVLFWLASDYSSGQIKTPRPVTTHIKEDLMGTTGSLIELWVPGSFESATVLEVARTYYVYTVEFH